MKDANKDKIPMLVTEDQRYTFTLKGIIAGIAAIFMVGLLWARIQIDGAQTQINTDAIERMEKEVIPQLFTEHRSDLEDNARAIARLENDLKQHVETKNVDLNERINRKVNPVEEDVKKILEWMWFERGKQSVQ